SALKIHGLVQKNGHSAIHHALLHLAVPRLHAGGPAGLLRPAPDAVLDLWLLAASYFFYAWWNPYYLLLVIYSTTLDYLLVTFMDHCPRGGREGGIRADLA